MYFYVCIYCVYKNKYVIDDNWIFYIKKKYLDYFIKSVGYFVVKIN